jgi:dipeptidyl-peptidase-4
MKQRFYNRYIIVSFLLLAFAVFASAQQKKRLTFDQIFRGAETGLTTPLPNITGWEDDSHYLEMRRKEGEPAKYFSVEAKSGKEKEVPSRAPDLGQFKDVVGSDINVNFPAAADEARTRLIYVKDKHLYFLNTATKEFKRLTQSPTEEKNPTLSPDANFVAFTRDNNLFAVDLNTGKETQYTNDGAKFIYNGYASWVYNGGNPRSRHPLQSILVVAGQQETCIYAVR